MFVINCFIFIREVRNRYSLVPVLSCPVLSCPVLSCPVLSCPVLSCPVLSCPVLSCSKGICPISFPLIYVLYTLPEELITWLFLRHYSVLLCNMFFITLVYRFKLVLHSLLETVKFFYYITPGLNQIHPPFGKTEINFNHKGNNVMHAWFQCVQVIECALVSISNEHCQCLHFSQKYKKDIGFFTA